MNDRDRLIDAMTTILERATAAAAPMTEYQCIAGIARRVLQAVNVHPYVTAGFLADEDPTTAEEDADRCRDETEAQARNEAISRPFLPEGW